MRNRCVLLLLAAPLLATVSVPALAYYHYWGGGVCYVYRNGQLDWSGWEDDYYFSYSNGTVTFYADGWWRVLWESGPNWADIRGCYAGEINDFSVTLEGKNLAGDVVLSYIPNGAIEIHMEDGGGILPGADVLAEQMTLHHTRMEGNMAGSIHVARLSQSLGTYFLRIGGDLTGTIDIGEDVVYPVSEIAIGGDIRDGGSITIGGNLNGKILVNGSLCDSVAGAEITVAGVMGSSATIAIDYDGWQSPDIWATGATISVDGTGYAGNTPADRVYEITRCKGDLNNDGTVTWRDIDPFVDALGDGAAYVANYPGLAGSRVFHADMDCDGVVNWRDIDPFVARMNGCCWEECGPCPELGGGASRPAPGVVADGLLTNIAPRNLARLLDLVRDAALLSPDAATRQYWADVRAALGD